MNLQMEINSLKQRITELEQQAKREQEFPQYGNTYWCINAYGGVSKEIWDGYDIEKDMLEIGNVFRTEQEAEFAVEKLKVEAELRKYSRPFKKGEQNWIILFDSVENHIEFSWTGVIFYAGVVYFENETEASKAIRSVGEERIKKYIFGVEE